MARKRRHKGKRKLHGAALAAHNKRMRRGSHRKGGSKRGKRSTAHSSVERRLTSLEHFEKRQKQFNGAVVHSIRRIYSATGIGTPSESLRLGKGR